VSHPETELTEKDYYLLGMIAEGVRYQGGRHRHKGELPHGCSFDQAERLVREGYLEKMMFQAIGRQEVIRYAITEKGRAAWRGYRFAGA
jgi:hypothetical protein